VPVTFDNAGNSWEGRAQWATLAELNVPAPGGAPPGTYMALHNWGTADKPATWLQVTLRDNLILQVMHPMGCTHICRHSWRISECQTV
jgi:hypothetical protein